MVIVLVLVALALPVAARLIVTLIATLLAVVMLRRSRRLERALLRAGAEHRHLLDYDHRPSRAVRRQMRVHLRLAIRQTELASLLPGIMNRGRAG